MIDSKEIEPFIDKYCRVGIPHDIIPDRLFFYFGWIRYVDNIEVKLEMNNGYRIIPLQKIMDIQMAQGGKQ
jgi:hypothetical protein